MKILIITQHIFPKQTPRALRSTELMIELAKQGHDVTVYAVLGSTDYSEFEEKTSIKIKNIPIKYQIIPYSSDLHNKRHLIDQILGKILGKTLRFPNIEYKYRIPQILKKELDCDLLISIADPHEIHWGVANFRRNNPSISKYKWVADCGDPCMHNQSAKGFVQKLKEKNEREFCELCDYISVPVESAKKAYYKEYRKKIKVIQQGFNFDEIHLKEYSKNEVPTFAFAGMFYSEIRNPTNFLEMLNEIKLEFLFIIYTPHLNLIKSFKKSLGRKLEIHQTIPRSELLSQLSTVDFLINLENENRPNQTPSKLIDYALTGRPILSVKPNSVDKELFISFLKGDYSKKTVINDLSDFKIQNVATKFIELVK
ncbi:MAG: hypothetical protein KJ941_05460 [Bacteroidetes bacterium]|nr:hypothetical protein [Bacteroidota bacterium]